MLSRIISALWEVTIQSSLLISAVLLIRLVFRNKLDKRSQYLLWILPLIRLLIPFSVESKFSIMNAVEPATEAIRRDFVVIGTPGSAAPSITGEAISAEQSFSWCNLIMLIWIAGVIAVAAATLYFNIRFITELKKSRKSTEMQLLSALCDELCVKNVPKLYISDKTASPCAVGAFRPSIYLPGEQASSQNSLRYILMHEITHIKRYDNLFALLRSICCAVYWFNPFVWLMAQAARTDCELACDASVVSKLGKTERIEYGMALISALQKQPKRFSHIAAAAMTTDKKEMLERINMIKNNITTEKWIVICVSVLMALVLLTACTTASAMSEDLSSQDSSSEGSDLAEVKEEVTLYSDFVAGKVNIEVRPNEYAGNAMMYVPDEECEAEIIALLQTLNPQKVESMLYLDEKLHYLGIVIWYNDRSWIVCDDGKLFTDIGDFNWGVIDCPQLTEIACNIAAEEMGLNIYFEPNQISNITSATLTCVSLNGVRYDETGEGKTVSLTDPKALAEIEKLLSTAESLGFGGAGCGFGNILTLKTAEGKTITIGLAQDSCSSYFVDGKWYDFTAGYSADNSVLYSFFGL